MYGGCRFWLIKLKAAALFIIIIVLFFFCFQPLHIVIHRIGDLL